MWLIAQYIRSTPNPVNNNNNIHFVKLTFLFIIIKLNFLVKDGVCSFQEGMFCVAKQVITVFEEGEINIIVNIFTGL